MSSETHFTTRRAFITAMGFGGVSLYGLWVAYGATPGPLALLGGGGDSAVPADGGGHGGHGGADSGPMAEQFSRMIDEFIERYSLPDGTVYPRILASSPMRHGDEAGSGDDHGTMPQGTMDHGAMGQGMTDHSPTTQGMMDHGTPDQGMMDHGTPDQGMMDHGTVEQGVIGPPSTDQNGHGDSGVHAEAAAPVEVLLAAGKWYYRPAKLRLDVGQPYRFRMMALDISHGASIQFGNGGRMLRLRPGQLSEMNITFSKPGRYLIHCTVYCGMVHDYMQATIEVV
jgi:plastocyanin